MFVLYVLGQTADVASGLVDHLLNYGLLGILLIIIGVVFWKGGKALWELLKYAITDPDAGALALAKRHVTNTETFLSDTLQRDEEQKELCRVHATGIQTLGEVVSANQETAEELAKVASVITRDTSEKISRVLRGMSEACDAVKEQTSGLPAERKKLIAMHCDRIKSLLVDK